jgi:hypothetical protein
MESIVGAVKMTFQLDLVDGKSSKKQEQSFIMDFKDQTLDVDMRLGLGILSSFNHSADTINPVIPDVRFVIHAETLTTLMNGMNLFDM